VAGCSPSEELGPRITPEEARTALIEFKGIRVWNGGDDDPVVVDLKTGPIVWRSASIADIGRFCSCNIADNSWEFNLMTNEDKPFLACAKGTFQRRADGKWEAISAGVSVS
jgi:hypothetical protein